MSNRTNPISDIVAKLVTIIAAAFTAGVWAVAAYLFGASGIFTLGVALFAFVVSGVMLEMLRSWKI